LGNFNLNIDNSFTRELEQDPVLENYTRQVQADYSFVEPQKSIQPQLIHVSKELSTQLGFTKTDIQSDQFLELVTGNAPLVGSKPYAMNYGGHQFGNWAGQLGDGRAINIAEGVHEDKRFVLQLKGAGKTPYSRRGDGRAVLRSSIREYLCSEAMHHLGVPSSRALSLSLSGDKILRDILYNGNPDYEKAAIVSRVAPSFIRFGNFELPSQRGDISRLKQLTDYTIKYFYPELGPPSKQTYIAFFKAVMLRTIETIIHWQRVGFVHGVLNTDNMSILGLTIDYGPYGWLDVYDPNWTPNTTDLPQRRYRFSNQPSVGLWNLYQLANALYPLIEEVEPIEEVLESYDSIFTNNYLEMQRKKLGLEKKQPVDMELLGQLEQLLSLTETDMTLFYRKLSTFDKRSPNKGIDTIMDAFYVKDELDRGIVDKWNDWFLKYSQRLKEETLSDQKRKRNMNNTNPKYVLRNYMAQLAIDAADQGDYSLIDQLYTMLKNPYAEQPRFEKWFAKRPLWAAHKVGCSMLSCSS
jgi:uncharacterized protein YdiU (UPF0061 family)